MNSTKLVLKNWFHFIFFIILFYYCYFLPLGICFAHKMIVCCLRCLEPSEKGGFSPAPCTSPLRDLPNSACLCGLTDLWLCYSLKGLCQGRTGITRILFKYPEDTAVQCQSPQVKACSSGLCCPGQGQKGCAVSVQLLSLRWADLLLLQGLIHSRFCDKALVGVTPTLHKVSALGAKSCADLQWFESAKSGPKM